MNITNSTGVYILIDRSASMFGVINNLLEAMNSYVIGLTPSTEITVAIFDDQGYDIIRRSVARSNFSNILSSEVTPRGNTPLNDSLAKIIARMEEDNHFRSVLVSVSDGAENSSKNETFQSIKVKLDRIKAKSEVIFFGANFDGIVAESKSRGIAPEYAVNMTTSNFNEVARGLSAKTNAYASMGASMAYSAVEKEDAVKVK